MGGARQLKRLRIPVVWREAWPFLLVLGLLAAGLVGSERSGWAVLPAALAILVALFLRDPDRVAPADSGVIVSPADGRVLSVREVEEPLFIGGRARLVSIFLSIADVHVNRSPIAGEVVFQRYVPGRFVAAYRDKIEEINERNYIGIRGQVDALVVQIAGLVARRIVCWPKVGDRLAAGERLGLIRFGSCTQVYLPFEVSVTVSEGDRVRGGETVIGRLPGAV